MVDLVDKFFLCLIFFPLCNDKTCAYRSTEQRFLWLSVWNSHFLCAKCNIYRSVYARKTMLASNQDKFFDLKCSKLFVSLIKTPFARTHISKPQRNRRARVFVCVFVYAMWNNKWIFRCDQKERQSRSAKGGAQPTKPFENPTCAATHKRSKHLPCSSYENAISRRQF